MKTFDEYQQETMKTAVYDKDVAVTYLALGLASEAGEVAGKVKKWVRGDTSYVDTDDIAKELGDVLWYVSQMAETFNLSLGDIAQANVDKLRSRMERDKIKGDGDNR
jgi:NTP pyrophosphatase (non-canonical NTP hydrolase)|tara:strand:+ start:156 stop:476 length:321 start_codon:yes stop_codon:yes gene_type:complete